MDRPIIPYNMLERFRQTILEPKVVEKKQVCLKYTIQQYKLEEGCTKIQGSVECLTWLRMRSESLP
jgi:hypothetical protein